MFPMFENNDLTIQTTRCHEINFFPPMYHRHAELYHVVEGKMVLYANNKRTILNQGDLYLVFPYVFHSLKKQKVEAEIILFDPLILRSFTDIFNTKIPKNPHLLSEQVPKIAPILIGKVRENYRLSEEISHAYLIALIGELLSVLKLEDVSRQSISTTQEILIYCSTHYNTNISIEKMAADLYINKNHISHIFSSKFHCSFRDYINHLRIERAKKQLAKTDNRIVDIMLDCGYMNQSSFNRIFYKLVGLTPREYRKKKVGDDT